MALSLVLCADTIAGEPLDLRLEFHWGLGQAKKKWQGRIKVDNGTFDDLKLLGMEADSSGAVLLSHLVVFNNQTERSYDGMQLHVFGDSDSTLTVELLASGQKEYTTINVRLSDLIERGQREELADGNSFFVRRVPDDKIRLLHDRKDESLIFSPDETWTFRVVPHVWPLSLDVPARCDMKLVRVEDGKEVWSQSEKVVSEQDRVQPLPAIKLPIPPEEGVYDLEIEMVRMTRRLTGRTARTIAKRRAQFVVIDSHRRNAPFPNEAQGEVILEFDPAKKDWWDQLTKLSQWSLLPGIQNNGPLGDHKPKRIRHRDRDWTQIEAGGWQAYPIPVDEVGEPHEVVIEYPSNIAQTTLVSVIEPNPAGKVLPIGLDSGFDVSKESATGISARPYKVETHRLRFWPRTKSPLLLIANRRQNQESVIGKIRVRRRSDTTSRTISDMRSRSIIAQFKRPLFAQNFSASETLDPISGRSLEDWSTFYAGATRTVKYLRDVGYDGLALSCYSEGSTIYPSRLLQPNSKYDGGILYLDGRDPHRKDVLELMFRLCDRENLTLIPMIDFSTPLPALERRIHAKNGVNGLRLINADGETWLNKYGTRRGQAPYYNVLNANVQEAMLDVVREIARRYQHHPSFGGIQIGMTPVTFSHLPGIDWAFDTNTIGRFLEDTKTRIPKGYRLAKARQHLLSPEVKPVWVRWRIDQLSDFYARMQAELASVTRTPLIYLSASGLAEAGPLRKALAPNLTSDSDVEQALREMGIDVDRFAQKSPNLKVMRPRKIQPITDLVSQGVDLELNRSNELAKMFRELDQSVEEFNHYPERIRLSSFEDLSPFGKKATRMALVATVSPSGVDNRRRFAHALASHDVSQIFEGGWMLPLGQEGAIRSFFDAYRQLPRERFEEFDSQASHPLTVRYKTVANRTYFYAVNDSPWDVDAEIKFTVPSQRKIVVFGESDNQNRRDGRTPIWLVNVPAYGLVGGYVDDSSAKLESVVVTLPPNVNEVLERRIKSLNYRLLYLHNPPALNLMENPDFDKPTDGTSIPGWKISDSDGGKVRLTSQGFKETRGLKLSNQSGSLTVQSNPFDVPETGQLAISIRARADSSAAFQIRPHLTHDSETFDLWPAIHSDTVVPGKDGWFELIFPMRRLPNRVQGKVRLDVKFDGPSFVTIDDVRLFDVPLMPSAQLAEIIGIARVDLEHGRVGSCLRTLERYWPQLLFEHVPEPAPQKMATPPAKTARKPAKRKNFLNRFNPFR